MKKKVNKKQRKFCFLILEVIILALCLLYLNAKIKYENVFYTGTVINEFDCSKMTVDEARLALEDKKKNKIPIIFKGDEIYILDCSKIYKIKNLQQELENIKIEQNKKIIFHGEKYQINRFSFNKRKLKKELSSIKQMQKDYMEKKSNVVYSYDSKEKKFKTSCKDSYYLNMDYVMEKVINALENNNDSVLITKYNKPKTKKVDEFNSKISSSVTYKLPNGKEYVLDADILHLWFKYGDNYAYNEKKWNEQLEKFVSDDLKPLVETVGKTRKFKLTGKDEKISIEGGNYGYSLDVEAELKQLSTDLKNQKSVKRQPMYKTKESSLKNDGIGNSYVELDISRQKVWVYVDGNLRVETDCVTGCVARGNDTPTGIYFLTYKQKDAILKGANYRSHVNYWMPFNGNIGLHDATWRKTFGGDIYLTNGSHGCVNLPLYKAKEVYGLVDKTMPIIVYKSE